MCLEDTKYQADLQGQESGCRVVEINCDVVNSNSNISKIRLPGALRGISVIQQCSFPQILSSLCSYAREMNASCKKKFLSYIALMKMEVVEKGIQHFCLKSPFGVQLKSGGCEGHSI